jgi:hypothetical protein
MIQLPRRNVIEHVMCLYCSYAFFVGKIEYLSNKYVEDALASRGMKISMKGSRKIKMDIELIV